MKFPIGLRASLSALMAGLALLVALVALAVHTALTVRVTVDLASDRARAAAQQASWLAERASAQAGPGDGSITLRADPALRSMIEGALAGDPTLFDVGVFDAKGRTLVHSQPDKAGQPQARRSPLKELTEGGVIGQGARLLGPQRVYDEVVKLRSASGDFGEVRVGVSTALLRGQLIDSLRAGLWVMGLALLLAVLVGLGFAQLLAQRVRTMTMGLERLSEGEFGHRLAVEGRDELALLASSINALGERLAATRVRAAAGEADENELLVATGQMAAWAKVASGLAHELADPLNAAALHLGQLKRKWGTPPVEVTRHMNVLESELKRLEQIVLGFRRFSMLGEMRADWFDLSALLREVVERGRETLHGRRVELTLDLDGAPQRFYGDSALLRQAVSNLISNAEQSMPGGGRVAVAARRGEDGVELSVSDEGMGIPEELQPRVFDLYFTTKDEGSGIGLAVVHQVVLLHAGQIRLRSTPGEGTEITLCLPERAKEVIPAA